MFFHIETIIVKRNSIDGALSKRSFYHFHETIRILFSVSFLCDYSSLQDPPLCDEIKNVIINLWNYLVQDEITLKAQYVIPANRDSQEKQR